MRARDSDQLANKLGRPAATLAAFRHLTPEQVGILSDAIDEAVAARRRAVDDAFRAALPSLSRRALLGVLRLGAGETHGRRRGWGPRRSVLPANPEEGGDGAPPGATKPPEAQ